MANEQPPTEAVLNLMNQGKSNEEIIQTLQSQGYMLQQINEAINQANIKKEVQSAPQGGNMANEQQYQPSEEMQISEIEKEPEIPVPTPATTAAAVPEQPAQQPAPETYMPSPNEMAVAAQQQPAMPQASYGPNYDDIQSLVEEIIDEKWRELMASIGDIATWKAQMADETEAIKQEILRIQSRFDNLQAAVLGKVDEYSKGITEIGSEMKALEKVFEKILEPLSSNIKELASITEKLREHKK
jgi:hypothetical protein